MVIPLYARSLSFMFLFPQVTYQRKRGATKEGENGVIMQTTNQEGKIQRTKEKRDKEETGREEINEKLEEMPNLDTPPQLNIHFQTFSVFFSRFCAFLALRNWHTREVDSCRET